MRSGRDLGGADGVRDVGHDLERHPEARVPRQLEPQSAQVEDLLHGPGEEDGHQRVVERDLGVGRQRRGLGLRVVAGEREDAALAADPREVGVLEDVPAPVHPGRLPVPHAEDAVVLRLREHVGELAAEDRGGPEVLVDAGDEDDLVLGEEGAVALERDVEAAQRRAPVAGDQRRGVEARGGGRRGAGRAAAGPAPGCRRGRRAPLPAGTWRRGRTRHYLRGSRKTPPIPPSEAATVRRPSACGPPLGAGKRTVRGR